MRTILVGTAEYRATSSERGLEHANLVLDARRYRAAAPSDVVLAAPSSDGRLRVGTTLTVVLGFAVPVDVLSRQRLDWVERLA
jgi:hypothetical protein